jgi:predicted negative regulator of RcsB-dependent stress response
MVPEAARIRKLSRRRVVETVLVFILAAILAVAGYQWFAGRTHAAHTSSTASVAGALTAVHTPAMPSGWFWTSADSR